jgi:hypothetical protein
LAPGAFFFFKTPFPAFLGASGPAYQQERGTHIHKKGSLHEGTLFCRKRLVLRLINIPQGSGAHKPEANIVVPARWGVVVPVR